MELDWLETFLAVVDRGGFTAASEQIHRSQSRVSAHIAALERHLGVQLIDRSRRPAVATAAGEVFARHAREIVAGVGSARAAVGGLRGLDQRSLLLVTTPCVAAAFLPAVLSSLSAERPGVRVELAEHGWVDVVRQALAEGAALAVVPTLDRPLDVDLVERPLWRERLKVVVPGDSDLGGADGPIPLERLVRHPLLVCRGSTVGTPEVLRALVQSGLVAAPRVVADSPQTVVSLVRAGVGVAVVNAVGLAALDLSGLAVLDIDAADAVRTVAAYWHPALLRSDVGRRLHRAVTEFPLPPGAEPVRPRADAAAAVASGSASHRRG